jgi:hypothetical protein
MDRRFCLAVLVDALTFPSFGCGKKEREVYPVGGTVTLDGKRLPEGTIYFRTMQTSSFDSFLISDGAFEGNTEAGERRVEITVVKTVMRGSGQMVGQVQENIIPKRYNVETELKATVTPDGPNQFKFEVQLK